MTAMQWTQQQFESMSWHDNHVHGLRLVEGQNGAGELVLDLDYIVEWLSGKGAIQFRIVPATLRFTDVTNLRIALDYATPSAALGPFSIHTNERQDEPRERYVAHVWRIFVNWPAGEITFEASGFEQRSTGEPIVSDMQHLSPAQRGNAASP